MNNNPFGAAALQRLEAFLYRHDGMCRPLTSDEVSAYGDREVVAAWRLRVAPGNDDRLVDVLVPPTFPFDPPRIGTAALEGDESPKYGMFVDDTLCLNIEGEPFPVLPDETAGRLALERAAVLLERWKQRPDEAVRAVEIASHWAAVSKAPTIYSLLDPDTGSRTVSYVKTLNRGQTYVADDKATLTSWLTRAGEKFAVEQINVGAFLDLPKLPQLFSNNAEMLKWVAANTAAEDLKVLMCCAQNVDSSVPVILRVQTPDGPTLLGAWLHDPTELCDGLPRSTKLDPVPEGADAVETITTRFFSTAALTKRAHVQRVDAGWLFTRGPGVAPPALLQRRVVLIGVGSLGSSLGIKLAKAGVGFITFIDPQILIWDNILRHYLGASNVGFNKALGMALDVERDLPYVTASWHDKGWEAVWRDEPEVFTGADLIVSTIAEWRSEALLNAISRTAKGFPNVLYGWVEDRAAVGQALYVSEIGGCLACGMSAVGEFSERVAHFPEPTIRRVAGCDAFFQPYSAAEAEEASTIIAETAIDALNRGSNRSHLGTWIAAKRIFDEHGGTIRQQWLAEHGDVGDGRKSISRDWPVNPACPFCGGVS